VLPAAASDENILMGSYRAETTVNANARVLDALDALGRVASQVAVLVPGAGEDSPCPPCLLLLPSAGQLRQRPSGLLAWLASLDMAHIRQALELKLPAQEKWHTPLHGQGPWVLLRDPVNVVAVAEVVGDGGLVLEP
jgi:hypothetical protein